MIVHASSTFAAPANTATNPTAASNATGRCNGAANAAPRVAPITNSGVTSPPGVGLFHDLVADLNLEVPDGVTTPRLHSLRHSFAVGCLTRWYRNGDDPTARLYQLSTFMGHVDPVSTAVYLTITTDLLTEANRRFETFASPAITEGVV